MTEANLSFEHVFEPSDEDDPAYVGLLLHGTGADEHDLVPLGQQLAPGKPLLSPLGKVRENGMPRWFRRIEEGVFDEEDLVERAGELADFVREATDAYDLDPDRVVAIGFSNGAVLMRAMIPLVPDGLPDLHGVPVYMANGHDDRLIPTDEANQLAALLDDAGADLTQRWADAGHQLGRDELAPIRDWLADHEETFAKPREER